MIKGSEPWYKEPLLSQMLLRGLLCQSTGAPHPCSVVHIVLGIVPQTRRAFSTATVCNWAATRTHLFAGSLLVVLLLRTAHYNLAKLRDVYLHTNTLAALANLAPYAQDLSSHAAQRLVSLFDMLARRRAPLYAIAAVEQCRGRVPKTIAVYLWHMVRAVREAGLRWQGYRPQKSTVGSWQSCVGNDKITNGKDLLQTLCWQASCLRD